MPIANKKKLACVPAVCIRVLVLIYYTQPLGTEGYRASVLYCYWYHAKKKNEVGSLVVVLLLIIGIHGFNSKSAGGSHCCCTSIQYCCIHGARSQRVAQSKAFTAFVVPTASEEARKPSHTHCAEKRQRAPSTSLHEKVEQKNAGWQLVGYTATAWGCRHEQAIQRPRLCEDRDQKCAASWMESNRTCRACQN